VVQPVDPDAVAYAWQQVARQILDLIAAGTWPPGRRIPSEADLAYSFEVARVTVRKGLSWLADHEVVVAQQGRGTFVAPALPDPLPDPPA
jgi:DNA-binding GntR family transcriptional regulator